MIKSIAELDDYIEGRLAALGPGEKETRDVTLSLKLQADMGGLHGVQAYVDDYIANRKRKLRMTNPDFELDEIHQAQALLTNS